LLIGGEFVDALDGATLDVINPYDGSVLAKVAEAKAADVDRAVVAAEKAFPAWKALAAAQRGRLLGKLADAIESHADELAELESRDTGHPIRDTKLLDAPRTAATFRYFAGMADKYQGSVVPVDAGFLNYVLREPVGVVGQIVPWNFPLMFTSWKMGPALAAGNTVVLKPAEITPLTTLKVAELMTEVGFPPGLRPHGGSAPGRASGREEDRVHRFDRHRAQNRAGLGGQSQARAVGTRRQGSQHRILGRVPAGCHQRIGIRDFP
jgi:acyl-CoA reductase-like NAD-dependent aldehyde dehydrogenase